MLWVIANFQFLTSVCIFNYGPPFRAHLWKNPLFLIALLASFGMAWVWIFKADPHQNTFVWNGFYLLDYRTPAN